MQRLTINFPAPVVALAVGGIMKLYALAAQIPIDQTPVLAEVGIRLTQVSAVIFLVAAASFWLARTTIDPLDPSRASTLVTGGIYRFSRNPMCLSLLVLLIAYAVRLGSWVALLGPAMYAIYVNRFHIIPEEKVLAEKFGAAFLAYKSRTRRWI